jgi:hypothetical protein
VSVVVWSLGRKIKKSQERRERLTKETEAIAEQVARSSEVTLRAASRVERAAAAMMERHNQALEDAARELRRK